MNARRYPLARSTQGLKRTGSRRPTVRPKTKPEGPCAYCGKPAQNWDHVVPKSLAHKLGQMGNSLPLRLRDVVESCFDCNILKGTRRLAPPSWAPMLDELNERISGAPFRLWNGDPKHPSYAEVWK